MRLIFVHGWSVTNTNTYGKMPQVLSQLAANYQLNLAIEHIYLGRYISFHDEVTVNDISRAMDNALRDLPGNSDTKITPFSCITHSTGGPVVRDWLDRYYGSKNLAQSPLKHLIMLAPANHGSALATLGKGRLGRIQAWFDGVEPGQRVLDWLCLGSDGQWSLNQKYLAYDFVGNKVYPFVLTGQGIDHNFYDFLNNYLVEEGSDGVVRVAGANMNCQYFRLKQDPTQTIDQKSGKTKLVPVGDVRKSKPIALGVYKDFSHSGTKMGVMRSAKETGNKSKIAHDILKCLQVDDAKSYRDVSDALSESTVNEQSSDENCTCTYCMLVISIVDDDGNRIRKDNYDMFLLAGDKYEADELPDGFFVDRQMNQQSSSLVYYLNASEMSLIKDGKFGLRVVARPDKGFSYYVPAEFRSDGIKAEDVFQPNETTYIEITLHRYVDENVMRFDSAKNGSKNFKSTKPSGKSIG